MANKQNSCSFIKLERDKNEIQEPLTTAMFSSNTLAESEASGDEDEN